VKKFLKQVPVSSVGPKGHKHTIVKQFCKGCRICVEFCPTGTLDLDDRFKVVVAHPEKCIACRMCELRCPEMAIFVEKGSRGRGVEDSSGESTKAEARSQMSEGKSQK
jgi:2-oxoglutarate ferredoxin oxidoreductase subunit delta